MTKLQTFLHHQLPDVFKWQVLSFMRVEWPFIFSGEYRFSQDTYPPELHPVHFVVVEDDLLISHAEIIKMTLNHTGTNYSVYGFGNVFTFPSFRGEGYGQKVVKAGTDYITNSDVDVAILFCDPEMKTFYEISGWEGLTQATTRIGTPGESKEHDGFRMMRFVSEKGRAGYSAFAGQPMYIDDPW